MSPSRVQPVDVRAAPRALELVLAHQLVGVVLALAEFAGRGATDFEILRDTYRQSFIILCSAGTLMGVGAAALAALQTAVRVPASVFYGVLLGAAAYPFGANLFGGGWISRQWFAPYGPALLACAALVVGWTGARLAERSRARPSWSWPATLAVLGTVLAVADARVLPDLYPILHVALLLGAWLTLALALVAIPWRSGARVVLPRLSWLPVAVITASVPLSWWKSPAMSHRLQWERSPGYSSRVDEQARLALWRLNTRRLPFHAAPAIESWLRSQPVPAELGFPAAAAAWNASARRPSRPAAARGLDAAPRPHIVLITVDALRADVAALGASWSALAARGLSFERAYAPASSTDRSLPVLLSGRYDGRRERSTVVRALAKAGYDTAFVTQRSVIDYLRYHDQVWLPQLRTKLGVAGVEGQRTSARIADAAVQLLRHHRAGVPMLAWVHFYDLHEWQYLSASTSTSRERYESVWHAVDASVGAVVRAAESALRDRPVVYVLTSDHGESLGEGGRTAHTRWVDLPLTHVPMTVIVPGRAPKVITRPVGGFDVAATLADVAGLTDFECDAVSLLREDVDPRRPVIMGDTKEIAIVRGRYRMKLAPFLDGVSVFDDAAISAPRRLDPRAIPNFGAEMLLPLLGSPMGTAASSPLDDP